MVGVVDSKLRPSKRLARPEPPNAGSGRGGVPVGVVDWLDSDEDGYGDGMRKFERGVSRFGSWVKIGKRGRSGVDGSSSQIKLENAGFLAMGEPRGSSAFVGLADSSVSSRSV